MEPVKRTPQNLFGAQVRYEIPEYQRTYVWDEETQWSPLWDDVVEITDANLRGDSQPTVPHFLGAVVLNQHPNSTGSLEKREVVDGQQRLITLQILMRAVANAIKKLELSDSVSQHIKQLNGLTSNPEEYWDGNEENIYKVWPSRLNQTSFKNVFKLDSEPDLNPGDDLILEAYRFFYEKAVDWFDNEKSKNEAVNELKTTLMKHLVFVIIDLSESDDANLIFETMNARGTPLLESDKIKNNISYEFGKISLDLNWYFDKSDDDLKFWHEEVGAGHNQRPRLDLLMNYWLTLRLSKSVKVRSEFLEFTNYISNKTESNKIVNVVDDLNAVATRYRLIERESYHELTNFENCRPLRLLLKTRNILGLGAMTPIIMFLLETCESNQQLNSSLIALESYVVRRWLCGASTRSYTEYFVSLMSKLKQRIQGDNFVSTIMDHLSSNATPAREWPNNEKLNDQLLKQRIYSATHSARINYILTRLEDEIRGGKAEELLSESSTPLHIEHIMPQKWEEHWPLISNSSNEIEHKDLLTRQRNDIVQSIGNLTLLSSKLNVEISNGPWELKRRCIEKHSILKLNSSDYLDVTADVWDEDSIKRRSTQLVKVCKRVWPIWYEIAN